MTSSDKYKEELKFWSEERDRYVKWYNGHFKNFYGVPAPKEHEKVTKHKSIHQNAIDTWVIADKWRYCKHLFVEPTYFSGKRILEVGCGPLGLGRWFIGASVYGVDPLTPEYQRVGYCLNHNIEYIPIHCENLQYTEDNFFDAVYSVNAIDHVDDFEKCIQEIERVTKPDGEIRIEVHYHEVHVTEPLALTWDRVNKAFNKFSVHCIKESPSSLFYPIGTHPQSDVFALWSNSIYLYEGMLGIY